MRRVWWIVAAAAAAVVLVVVLAFVLAPTPPVQHPAAVPVTDVPLAPGANSDVSTMASREWVRRVSAATGIPERALISYGGAAWAESMIQPGCHLGWTTIAAIGAVESDHGRHAGSSLDADGVATPPIFGPLLDGKDYAEVKDTDGGALDGNTQWDRAVGPMQFVPSSWANWEADADTDGTKNPQDMDDAAFATAGYLCRVAEFEDMRDPATWRTAIGGYNASEDYIDLVAQTANEYAEAAGVTVVVEPSKTAR
jgi:membrane-bound lytic murein transglycosylase B